jgi:lipoyl(octanoyl) transferase
VEELICRLLPFENADGPANMATDEMLLQAAISGVATLRFYGWTVPTLSLGYFQSEKLRHGQAHLAELPFVRRPSGGAMLVHHHELTYALGLPPGNWEPGRNWPLRMHQIIVAALAELRIGASVYDGENLPRTQEPLCFRHITPGDVWIGRTKVAGSAQRKCRGAMLQHGGILLAQSPFAPTLKGIQELTGCNANVLEIADAVRRSFKRATLAQLVEGKLSDSECARREELRAGKYASANWNCKR